MQRTIWKGAISFGLVHIPVQVHSAENSHELDLTMLDRRDFAPIGYKRINKNTGSEVQWPDIVKGYEYELDQYVVLSDEDLKRANIAATQTIDILAFVEAQQVPLIHYERPYYLSPDKGGDKVYALLREVLSRSGKIAIAQIVMRTKQHLVALVPVGDMIVMNTLRYADEIRSIEQFNLPKLNSKQAGVTDKELQMAMSLVEGMSEDWDAGQYRDTYKDDVMAMVEKKIQAHQTKTITEPEKEAPQTGAKIIDLMALLKESIDKKSAKETKRSNGGISGAEDATSYSSKSKKSPGRSSVVKQSTAETKHPVKRRAQA